MRYRPTRKWREPSAVLGLEHRFEAQIRTWILQHFEPWSECDRRRCDVHRQRLRLGPAVDDQCCDTTQQPQQQVKHTDHRGTTGRDDILSRQRWEIELENCLGPTLIQSRPRQVFPLARSRCNAHGTFEPNPSLQCTTGGSTAAASTRARCYHSRCGRFATHLHYRRSPRSLHRPPSVCCCGLRPVLVFRLRPRPRGGLVRGRRAHCILQSTRPAVAL
jgi:hypothetical protein